MTKLVSVIGVVVILLLGIFCAFFYVRIERVEERNAALEQAIEEKRIAPPVREVVHPEPASPPIAPEEPKEIVARPPAVEPAVPPEEFDDDEEVYVGLPGEILDYELLSERQKGSFPGWQPAIWFAGNDGKLGVLTIDTDEGRVELTDENEPDFSEMISLLVIKDQLEIDVPQRLIDLGKGDRFGTSGEASRHRNDVSADGACIIHEIEGDYWVFKHADYLSFRDYDYVCSRIDELKRSVCGERKLKKSSVAYTLAR